MVQGGGTVMGVRKKFGGLVARIGSDADPCNRARENDEIKAPSQINIYYYSTTGFLKRGSTVPLTLSVCKAKYMKW